MSTETFRVTRRVVLVGLCVALLLTVFTLILAPVVGAASDTIKTETETNETIDITSAEDALLIQRAITIDEAKKEAQVVVSEQLAIQEAARKAETEATEAPQLTEDSSYEEETYAEYDDVAESSSDSGSDYGYTTTVSASSDSGYLLDIDNPDPDYTAYSVSLSDADRDMAERILMGEAGNEGYIGMALVAQCIRDTYVRGSYSSIEQLLRQNGYYGSTSITPNSTAKEVVNYIFDQGGSAVQHKVSIFYATNMCYSAWHEAQDFVCQYNYVRFFDY